MKHSTFFAIIQLVGSCASPVFAQEIDINAELHKNWGQNSDAKFTIKWKQAITITGYVDEAAFKEMSAYAELRRAAEIESRKQDGTAIITAELKRPKEQQYSNLYTISIDGSKWKIIKKGYLYIPSQSNEPISHDYSVLYNGDKVIEYVNPGLKESAFGSLNNMTTNVFFDTDVGRIIYCQLLGAQHPLLRRFITDNLDAIRKVDLAQVGAWGHDTRSVF